MDPVLAKAIGLAKNLAKFRYQFGQTSAGTIHRLAIDTRGALTTFFPRDATPQTFTELRDALTQSRYADFSEGMLGQMEQVAVSALRAFLHERSVSAPSPA